MFAGLATWLIRPVRPRSWWAAVHTRLLAWVLRTILAAARRCVGFVVTVDQACDLEPFRESRPVLVIARHGGPGDSFALVHLLLDWCRRPVRIVLKEFLQWDPGLDLLLNRLGCCFLPTSDVELLADRVAEVAGRLESNEALLLFPEGGNWSPERRRRAIRRLRRERKGRAVVAALATPRVLPPRPAGVTACLDVRPDLAVVVVAHTGLELITTARLLWEALPFTRPMLVCWWRADPAPAGDDARIQWLTAEWARVNEWISSHGPRVATSLPPERLA
jgi:1-acyl-sn-glycerol-3-phosphate acyltransferase